MLTCPTVWFLCLGCRFIYIRGFGGDWGTWDCLPGGPGGDLFVLLLLCD